LKQANDQAEHFERLWYLRGDEIERLEKICHRHHEANARLLAVLEAAKQKSVPWSQALESVWAEDDTTPPAAEQAQRQPLTSSRP
jgi:hypothetical protein